MSEPLVSILIPTYNQAEFVRETILSAVGQHYGNLEVVVADDASQDGTAEILRQLASEHPGRLIPVYGDVNLGVSGNFNRGLQRCRGEFVAFQGGDDVLLPDKVSRQVAFLLANDECALCYHNVDVFDSESGATIYLWSKRYGSRRGDVRSLVRYGPTICATSVMARRKDLPAGGCDLRIRVGSDWLLFIQILAASGGTIGYLDEVLARYRRHRHNVTSAWDWKLEDQLLTLSLVESSWPHMLTAARRRRADLFATAAVRHAAAGRYTAAARFFAEAWLQSFPNPFAWLRLVWREAAFLARQRGRPDDLMRGFLAKK